MHARTEHRPQSALRINLRILARIFKKFWTASTPSWPIPPLAARIRSPKAGTSPVPKAPFPNMSMSTPTAPLTPYSESTRAATSSSISHLRRSFSVIGRLVCLDHDILAPNPDSRTLLILNWHDVTSVGSRLVWRGIMGLSRTFAPRAFRMILGRSRPGARP